MWKHFRRLLLGTVIEIFVEEGIDVRSTRLGLQFDDESAFRVPRLNNYMRFKGSIDAPVEGELSDAQLDQLRDRLDDIWPDLLSVVEMPVGDRLTDERNQVTVERHSAGLRIRFDLEAD